MINDRYIVYNTMEYGVVLKLNSTSQLRFEERDNETIVYDSKLTCRQKMNLGLN